MECSEKRVFPDVSEEALNALSIDAPDPAVYRKVLDNWDWIAKPLDGLGRFESMTARIGAILGTDEIDISKKAVIIMCADNGIVEEGVSQTGQEMTALVAKQMAKGASSVGKMAAAIGADTIPVDIGMREKERIPGVLDKKIRHGSRNFMTEPALTRQETLRAVFTGMELVSDCKRNGYQILATGEMGIGNTTTSSAVAAALLKCTAEEVTGRGAGLSDEKFFRKKQVVSEAVSRYRLSEKDPLMALQAVGGYDIAGLAGICIGGAVCHIPIVLDGVISQTAALLAEKITPGAAQYLIPSHKGREPAAERLLRELGLTPVIDADMALGEGTGAVMMLSLLDVALAVYREKTLFSDIQARQYERYGSL